MTHLKQSTAVTIKFGPFLDEDDGKTAETGLAISQADVRLSKNGGDFAQKNESSAATHDELGIYDVDLDTTDTGTLGRLFVAVHEGGALPVWREFMVVPENVWDSLYGADNLQVDAVEISGDSVAANNLEAACDGTTYNIGGGAVVAASVTGAVGSVTGSVGSVTGAVGSVTGAVGSVTGNVGGNVAGSVASVTDKAGFSLAADQSAVTVGTVTTVTNMRGTDNAALASVCTEARLAELGSTNLPADIDAILADTGTDGVVVAGASKTGYSLAADQSGVTIGTVTTASNMRGTDNAALASVCTEARLAELAAANLPADIDAILADTGTDGVVVASASKTGYALSASGIDGVLDEVVEGTTTFRQMLRGFASALLGKLSGGGTTTITIRDVEDTKNRIVATVDGDGNRTSYGTLDLT